MKCPLCNQAETAYFCTFFRGRDIYRCPKCNNAFTFPFPKKNYTHDKFSQKSSEDELLYRNYANNFLSYVKKYIHKGRLLDVGCGGGLFVAFSGREGFTSQGIDPSKNARRIALNRNVCIKKSAYGEKSYPGKSFDAITMSHVLEHNRYPLQLIRAARFHLTNNGLLFMAQTNYQGTIPSYLKGFWEGWVSNEHYYHFSEQGIADLLIKGGFKVINITTLPLGYHLRWKWGGKAEIANNLYNSINYLISKFKIGWPFTGDQMYITASKK